VDLITRWCDLVARAGLSDVDGSVGRALIDRWRQPHRRYHNADHLTAVLSHVDTLAEHAADADAVRLAAWYHDAVYDGKPGEDELASAALAEQELSRLGLAADRLTEVVRLVRLTASHQPEPGDRNGEVLCDADLAVLAGDAAEYGAYAAAVRAEYAHVPDELFRLGRAQVLHHLLAMPTIFRTSAARERWEQRARENLRAELS